MFLTLVWVVMLQRRTDILLKGFGSSDDRNLITLNTLLDWRVMVYMTCKYLFLFESLQQEAHNIEAKRVFCLVFYLFIV